VEAREVAREMVMTAATAQATAQAGLAVQEGLAAPHSRATEVQHHGCHLLNIGPQSQSPDRLPDLVRASGVVFRLGLGLRLGPDWDPKP